MRRASTRRPQRGAVAVELAFVAVLLALMAAAVVEYTRAMYTYTLLVKATRDGARFLSGFDPTAGPDYPVESAVNRMIWGAATAGADSDKLIPGLDPGMIRICDRSHADGCPPMTVATGTGTISLVRVEITGFVFTPAFPLVSRMTTVTFEPIATTMRQVL